MLFLYLVSCIIFRFTISVFSAILIFYYFLLLIYCFHSYFCSFYHFLLLFLFVNSVPSLSTSNCSLSSFAQFAQDVPDSE